MLCDETIYSRYKPEFPLIIYFRFVKYMICFTQRNESVLEST